MPVIRRGDDRAARDGQYRSHRAVIAQGRGYRETFLEFDPAFDLSAQREARAAAGRPEHFDESDLYADVRPALAQLREAGLWLGIAGNQTVRAGRILRELFAQDVDLIGTSDDWGASKPDPEFFVRVAAAVPFRPAEILYVGDRVDNDLRPGAAAGLHTALVRRGPWVTIQWNTTEARELPTFRLASLTELPEKIAKCPSLAPAGKTSAALWSALYQERRLRLNGKNQPVQERGPVSRQG